MDIGKAFTFVFDDKDWIVKILIAAAIVLAGVLLGIFVIPAVVAFALLGGYGVEITRRVIHSDSPVLPAWDNWGALLSDGLKVWIIGLVYTLPIILISVCLGIPTGILAQEAEEVSQIFSLAMSCLNFLWGIPMGFLLPAAIAFFAAEGELGAAFRFGDIFAFLRDNFQTYLITFLLTWVASFIGGLGVIVCGLGWSPATCTARPIWRQPVRCQSPSLSPSPPKRVPRTRQTASTVGPYPTTPCPSPQHARQQELPGAPVTGEFQDSTNLDRTKPQNVFEQPLPNRLRQAALG
jgi:hypothetical protein